MKRWVSITQIHICEPLKQDHMQSGGYFFIVKLLFFRNSLSSNIYSSYYYCMYEFALGFVVVVVVHFIFYLRVPEERT